LTWHVNLNRKKVLKHISQFSKKRLSKNIEKIMLCVALLPCQARERSEKERLKKQQELDDNMTEIANHVFGDVLTENPAVAQSAFGPHRVIPDRWKGMSPSQLEDIRKQQEKQRMEREVCTQSPDGIK